MSDAPKMTEREELLKLCDKHMGTKFIGSTMGESDASILACALKECLERTPPTPTLTKEEADIVRRAHHWGPYSEVGRLVAIITRLTSVPSPPETLKPANMNELVMAAIDFMALCGESGFFRDTNGNSPRNSSQWDRLDAAIRNCKGPIALTPTQRAHVERVREQNRKGVVTWHDDITDLLGILDLFVPPWEEGSSP